METTTCMATPPEQVDSLIHVRHRINLSSATALHSCYVLNSLISCITFILLSSLLICADGGRRAWFAAWRHDGWCGDCWKHYKHRTYVRLDTYYGRHISVVFYFYRRHYGSPSFRLNAISRRHYECTCNIQRTHKIHLHTQKNIYTNVHTYIRTYIHTNTNTLILTLFPCL